MKMPLLLEFFWLHLFMFLFKLEASEERQETMMLRASLRIHDSENLGDLPA